MDIDSFIQIERKKTKTGNITTAKRKLFSAKNTQKFDVTSFGKYLQTLDDTLDGCLGKFYNKFIDKVSKLLSTDSAPDTLPTLYVYGQAPISYDRLSRLVSEACRVDYKNIHNHLIEGLESDKSEIFYLVLDDCATNEEISNSIARIMGSENKYLLLYFGTSQYTSQKTISRIVFSNLTVSETEIPPPNQFLELYFDEFLQMGVLDKRLFIDGELLEMAHNRYLHSDYSVCELRKCLAFALLNFALSEHQQQERQKNDLDLQFFQQNIIKYMALLDVFVNKIALGQSTLGSSKFLIHCKIQSRPHEFEEYLNSELRKSCANWTRATCIQALSALNCYLTQNDYHDDSTECASLLTQLQDIGASDSSKTSLSSTMANKTGPQRGLQVKKMQSTKEYKNKQLNRARAMKDATLVPTLLQGQIYDHLYNVLSRTLTSFPNAYVARIPDKSALNTCLTLGINNCLRIEPNTDSTTLYQLIIVFAEQASIIRLNQLFPLFKQHHDQNNAGYDDHISVNARFYNALAHLELIGIVKFLSQDAIKLIHTIPLLAQNK